MLKKINKGETFESTRDAILKAKEAGIKSSVMIINGMGGKDKQAMLSEIDDAIEHFKSHPEMQHNPEIY